MRRFLLRSCEVTVKMARELFEKDGDNGLLVESGENAVMQEAVRLLWYEAATDQRMRATDVL